MRCLWDLEVGGFMGRKQGTTSVILLNALSGEPSFHRRVFGCQVLGGRGSTVFIAE